MRLTLVAKKKKRTRFRYRQGGDESQIGGVAQTFKRRKKDVVRTRALD